MAGAADSCATLHSFSRGDGLDDPQKPLKMKSSGAEACAEGPFLKWQNHSCKAAKAPGERGHPSPPSPKAGKRELPTSGSSDSAGAGSSVTAAKHPHI